MNGDKDFEKFLEDGDDNDENKYLSKGPIPFELIFLLKEKFKLVNEETKNLLEGYQKIEDKDLKVTLKKQIIDLLEITKENIVQFDYFISGFTAIDEDEDD